MASPASPRPPIRSVNLGNWLVTEGWMLPSLFDGLPNKDLLDGTQLQFKSVTQNAFVAAENGGGAALVANRPSASGWETFKLYRINQNTFNFKVFSNQFITVAGVNVVATASTPVQSFQLVRNDADQNRMRIRAPNGSLLQANKDGSVTADFRERATTWGDDDPSVFVVTIVKELPSLFDDILNKDLLDGTQLQFRSVTQNAFVAAENGGGATLVANRASASSWETFKLWRIDKNTFNFKVFSNQFVTVAGVNVVATASTAGQSETFQLVRNDADKDRMRIRAPNGSFLQANKDGTVMADFGESTTWGDDDSSVFVVTIITDGWILRSLFGGIPNNDLMDDTQLQFKSVTQNAFVAAENGGGAALFANRPSASGWETFKLHPINQNNFNLKVFSNEFVTVVGVNVVATASTPGQSETFQLVRNNVDKNRIRIRAPNGSLLQANKDGSMTADFGESTTTWGDDDPSVFVVTIVKDLPSLFDDIPNKDLLQDGTQLQLRSMTQNAFVAAENGGGAALVANRASASGWETFKLWRIDQNTFNLKVFSNQSVTVVGVNMVATASMPGPSETFKLVRNKNMMRIKAPNGSFVQANKDGSLTANFGESTTWGDDDPSVFAVTIVRGLPSLFDGIPNKDLLDSTLVQFKSMAQKGFLAAENGGGGALVANRPSASDWETFKLWRIDENTFNFKVFSNQFVTVAGVNVVATASMPGQSETFQLVRNDADNNKMRIRAPNGSFLQANKDGSVTADFVMSTKWGDDDPSVFAVTIVGQALQGEYQICNGYGKDTATQVMNDHRSTYIVERDFTFMAANGLNAVRIPVGWWIASDPNPPAPFVGGSLQALDNAFTWAERHNIGVIIDLHAAPGAQNPWEHGGSRDGSRTWGDSNIAETVQVIDFLAARYARRSGLLAVELMNEPVAPGVSLDSLKRYYQQGYNAVRKHSPTAYVIMSNRIAGDWNELVDFASPFSRTVLDGHHYLVFEPKLDNSNVQQNIDFVNKQIASDLSAMTRPDGPLTFVGEWVAEWKVKGASKEDFQRCANAQMAVYRKATFGWAYWSYKHVSNHWSMEWMINNGYISLKNA
ncbi:uncharacterized protein [Triticum aestivum]|uniref:uncharacterized protein isoform X1 n=1 Tax=Triticum aestivum TaxID=4565 RepID=UPI001D012D49|nr:uncharacterized protein LOC123179806 isoform X1 [Triticum aestivum]